VKLADVNLLIALADTSHTHHTIAKNWRSKNRLTTCPITELGVVRVLIATGLPASDAFTALTDIKKHAEFVVCDLEVSELAGKVTGHRQTTDAYLLELAKAHKGKLYTLDTGIKGAELVT
jgi:predicted nucleic acid-binding protein